MKKRMWLLLLIPIVVVSICGCASSDSTNVNGSAGGSTTSLKEQLTTSTATSTQPATVSHAVSSVQAGPFLQPSAGATKAPSKTPTYAAPTPSATKTPTSLSSTPSANGPFDGCKACDIYHYPWYSEVKHILPENLVIFASSAEARAAACIRAVCAIHPD